MLLKGVVPQGMTPVASIGYLMLLKSVSLQGVGSIMAFSKRVVPREMRSVASIRYLMLLKGVVL